MAKGNKFNGTQIKFAVGYDEEGKQAAEINTSVMTAPVVTLQNHGLKTADLVWLSGVAYSSASGYFPVKVNDENSFVLVGVNFSFLSTDEIQAIRIHKAKVSGMCDAKNIKITSFNTSSEDVTTNCDEVKMEEYSVEAGESSMDINFKDDNDLHLVLENFGETQTPTYIQLKRLHGKRVRGFKTLVSAFEYSGEVNSYYSGSVNFKHQSLKHDILLD